MSTFLVTGAAGFIGAWTAKALVEQGHRVIGLDNFNSYYDVALKEHRVRALIPSVKIHRVDLADGPAVDAVVRSERFDKICHLGAQAGVRYSLENPLAYEASNNLGTLNVFEAARKFKIPAVIYASSSSVYGANTKTPFAVGDPVDRPVSLYAATKRSNELMAETYQYLYGIHMTGLRFFTVYGPWGRPDMAYFSFTQKILAGEPIDVFNFGKMKRDFTYITDIVAGISAALGRSAPSRLYNLGNSFPVELGTFIGCLEDLLGKKALKNNLPMQPGDVPATWADIDLTSKDLGFAPKTDLRTGLTAFVEWYRGYFHPK